MSGFCKSGHICEVHNVIKYTQKQVWYNKLKVPHLNQHLLLRFLHVVNGLFTKEQER